MNNKEVLTKAQKYADLISAQLQAPVPAKHVNSPATYKAFLERELKMVKAKIEALKVA